MQEYGFEENIDFCTKMFKSTGGRPSTDYLLKIDMAKELCMIQRTPKGKQARQYFLRIEKEFNSPQKVMARALLMADKQLHCLKLEVKELKPKALFADAVQTSHTSILIGELAKLLKQNGVDTGQRRLFQWMRDNGYLMKSGSSRNMPTQYSMERGLFEIKESTVSNPDGSVRVTKTPKVTGKGQIYFVNKFIKQVS
jgi:anti-repressor protein